MADFGVSLLLSALKRKQLAKADTEHQRMLSPLVELLTTCFEQSRSDLLTAKVAQALTVMLNWPLAGGLGAAGIGTGDNDGDGNDQGESGNTDSGRSGNTSSCSNNNENDNEAAGDDKARQLPQQNKKSLQKQQRRAQKTRARRLHKRLRNQCFEVISQRGMDTAAPVVQVCE